MGAVTRASGFASTAMGDGTTASGDYSTALGFGAQATNSGSFVWADASLFAPPFTSTASNQFAVRASGGFYLQGNLGIGRPSPNFSLGVWSEQAVGHFASTNSTLGSFLVLQNETPAPDYLGAVFFADSTGFIQGEIGYQTYSGGQMRFRVGGTDRMRLNASGLTVNSAGGPEAYLGGDGAGGDVQLGSATAGNEAVALWNSADGDYMDLFARSGNFQGNVAFGANTRQMINLWNTAYGIGVQANAAYFRTDNEFMWFKGGSHTNVFGDPGQGGTQIMRLGNSGNLVIAGTLSQGSDRNIKQDFAALDGREVLEKVSALPIQSWSYTNQPGVKHYGPTAQDFHAAFGLNGSDDKHIATVDADGVALAAIQGLNQKLEQKLEQKQTEITELKQRLEALEKIIHSHKSN
ncbi:MAG: tail fiber domain-containing protein [Akkermansiaceae bacterium]|nr:tail fiber domain-containing protein [Verrucomicrobiales bacterium]